MNGNPGRDDVTSYSSWKAFNGVTDDDGDNDGDGLTNLMEYALGGDPFGASLDLAPFAEVRLFDDGGANEQYIFMDVRRRLGADDVALVIEVSNSLGEWANDEGSPSLVRTFNNGDGTESLTYRLEQPVNDARSVFMRARFLLSP